jgi:HIV Tat-specific factor 1
VQKRAKPDKPTKQAEPPKQQEPEQKTIYVTNLPKDATLREVVAFFAKAGMIAESIGGVDEKNKEEPAKDEDVESDTDTDRSKRRPEDKRVKLYREEDGTLKGDALITYFSKDSIPTALMLFDDRFFQDLDKGQGKMSVKLADLSYKKNKDGPTYSNPKDKKLAQKKAEEMKR